MTPETAIQWALLAAEAAMKILDQIQDKDTREEAARQTRAMITDQKLLLRAEAQRMLDRRRRED